MGGWRQTERWREKGELIFLLGLCISWLGNRVEMERRDEKGLVLVSSTLLGSVCFLEQVWRHAWSSSLELFKDLPIP